MRIVAGKHRGRTIEAPPGSTVRPTGDRVREALFNILDHGAYAADGSPFRGRHVLDAFSGTGALGLEALSRGAGHASFLENSGPVRQVLQANITKLGESGRSSVIAGDATKPPRATSPAALVLMDPPYGEGLGGPTLVALTARGWLSPGALAVVEVAAKEAFAPPDGFALIEERIYGAARLVFLRAS